MVEVVSSNPLMAGLPLDLVPQPSTFVILGAAGDLARRKLLPALYNLALDGLLPVSFAVLGVALNDLDDAAFRALAQEGVMRFSRRRLDFTRWSDFARAAWLDRDKRRMRRRRMRRLHGDYRRPDREQLPRAHRSGARLRHQNHRRHRAQRNSVARSSAGVHRTWWRAMRHLHTGNDHRGREPA